MDLRKIKRHKYTIWFGVVMVIALVWLGVLTWAVISVVNWLTSK